MVPKVCEIKIEAELRLSGVSALLHFVPCQSFEGISLSCFLTAPIPLRINPPSFYYDSSFHDNQATTVLSVVSKGFQDNLWDIKASLPVVSLRRMTDGLTIISASHG